VQTVQKRLDMAEGLKEHKIALLDNLMAEQNFQTPLN
jgi:hypothetical protein